MSGDVVTIGVTDYEELLEDSMKLQALQDVGVDNWDGYSEAMKLFQKRYAGEDA